MLVHGNRLPLMRNQVPDLTNNTFSFSLFNCRRQSEFILCMLGHEEEQFPHHPLCWLFLTVCMKLRAAFFPTNFSNESDNKQFRIAHNHDGSVCLESLFYPVAASTCFSIWNFSVSCALKLLEAEDTWVVRSTLALPSLCTGRSGL